MESILLVVDSMVNERNFTAPEELTAFLEEISEEDFRRARTALMENDPRLAAQLLAYSAMLDAQSEAEAASLARRALERDPQCLDARVILAELEAGDVGDFIAAMEEIVETGRAALDGLPHVDQDGFRENLAARPYLRAHFRLAEAWRVCGRTRDAITSLEALLGLDPSDNQRAREPLLACYLAVEEIGAARRLLTDFASDRSAVFHWARVLERYLSEDPEGALAELRRARRQNRHAQDLLTFRKAVAELNPDSYLPGTEEEAVHCMYILGLAWANYPAAIHWVLAN